MWSWASGVIVMTYDDVSVAGAAVSVDARQVRRRATGMLRGAKAEVHELIARAASARRRTMLSQR